MQQPHGFMSGTTNYFVPPAFGREFHPCDIHIEPASSQPLDVQISKFEAVMTHVLHVMLPAFSLRLDVEFHYVGLLWLQINEASESE
jgi:hypothetical protein